MNMNRNATTKLTGVEFIRQVRQQTFVGLAAMRKLQRILGAADLPAADAQHNRSPGYSQMAVHRYIDANTRPSQLQLFEWPNH
jgi:hypothetical protein